MPLISLCGLPCSGKTTRALEIAAGLKDIMPVHIINDASLGLDRSIYDASVGEKRARGAILSAVERLLSKQVVVIVDGMNYVKGFRYQLFCLARAMTTHHCVVYCGVSGDIARAWNEARSAKDAYPAEQFDSLVMRFEEPDGARKWDAPLFTVLPEDAQPPMEEIIAAITIHRATHAKLSTLVQPVGMSNDVHDADRMTQQIVDSIMASIQEGAIPSKGVSVPGTDVKVMIPPEGCTLAEIRRLRRQFGRLSAGRVQGSRQGTVAALFAEYLNTNL